MTKQEAAWHSLSIQIESTFEAENNLFDECEGMLDVMQGSPQSVVGSPLKNPDNWISLGNQG